MNLGAYEKAVSVPFCGRENVSCEQRNFSLVFVLLVGGTHPTKSLLMILVRMCCFFDHQSWLLASNLTMCMRVCVCVCVCVCTNLPHASLSHLLQLCQLRRHPLQIRRREEKVCKQNNFLFYKLELEN